jgi:hypothetical protein
MANKHPKYKFPKGNKLGGREATSEEIKNMINSSREGMAKDLCQIELMTPSEGGKIKKNAQSYRFNFILEAFETGNDQALKMIYDRVHGKAKESVELSGNISNENINLNIPINGMAEKRILQEMGLMG